MREEFRTTSTSFSLSLGVRISCSRASLPFTCSLPSTTREQTVCKMVRTVSFSRVSMYTDKRFRDHKRAEAGGRILVTDFDTFDLARSAITQTSREKCENSLSSKKRVRISEFTLQRRKRIYRFVCDCVSACLWISSIRRWRTNRDKKKKKRGRKIGAAKERRESSYPVKRSVTCNRTEFLNGLIATEMPDRYFTPYLPYIYGAAWKKTLLYIRTCQTTRKNVTKVAAENRQGLENGATYNYPLAFFHARNGD